MHDRQDVAARRRRMVKSQQGLDIPLGESSGVNPQLKRKKRRRRSRDDEPPFHVLFLQVGAIVTIVFLSAWRIYLFVFPESNVSMYDDDYLAGNQGIEERPIESDQKQQHFHVDAPPDENSEDQYIPSPLQSYNLSVEADFDAFALSEIHHHFLHGQEARRESDNLQLFWNAAAGLRNDFAKHFGGEKAARALIDLGLSASFEDAQDATTHNKNSLPKHLVSTACRILVAKNMQRPFKFSFGGYSVTVGRGNYFQQSFPFFMDKKLHTLFQLLGVHLEVKNAAIGGCPSFPYGWCLENFLGNDSDVISWDFSMNEASRDPAMGLEAYIRHASQLPKRPKLIVKDTSLASERRAIVRYYHDYGILTDPVILHTDSAAAPFLEQSEEDRLPGFQKWRVFGAPHGAPGQASHHPAVKEHEFNGWLLALHFLGALEVAASSMQHHKQPFPLQCSEEGREVTSLLPPPITLPQNTTNMVWQNAFFGEKSKNTDEWIMRPRYCLTSFEPTIDGVDLVKSAVSGHVGTDLDVMLPKSKMYYNKGWVLDLSESEKRAKQRLSVFGGLGFLDSKKAFYGILMSGELSFLVPYRASTDGRHMAPEKGMMALDWFHSLVLCEVNEKLDADSCDMRADLAFRIGGVSVDSGTTIDAAGAMYLGKKLCIYIPVPANATLTTPGAMKVKSNKSSKNREVFFPDPHSNFDSQVGLEVAVRVRNPKIVQRSQACSISHIMWQQQNLAN